MRPISRRGLLRAAGAGAFALPLAGRAAAAAGLAAGYAAGPPHRWVGAGPFAHVHDPSLPGRRRYLNDHTLIRAGGRWHVFGIVGDGAPPGQAPDSAAEISFAHASAPGPYGPWTPHPDALTADPSYYGEEHLWAPYVLEAGGTFWMFYAAGGPAGGAAVNAATSTDLSTWTRLPSGPLFRGLAARDPMVLRTGGEWVMYYTELSGPHGHHVVACRRSADLVRWSGPETVFTDASTDATVSVTESPYVVERDGWYYLFTGPRGGYEGTDVFASRDPFRFGPDGWAGHVPGHAVEVFRDGEEWYASAAGWFRQGLYVAPLLWRDAPPPWQSPDNPVVAPDVDGRLNLFALDAADRGVLRRVQTGPDADDWSPWEAFGGPAGAVPALGRNTNGRLEVFALSPGGTGLYHRVQRPDGGWWDWEEFGGPAGGAPAVVRAADGRLEAYAAGPAGAWIARRRQRTPGSLVWDPWDGGFGGPAGAPPAVAANADGRLEVFVLSPGGAGILHRWEVAPGGAWSGWAPFGTAAGSAPRVARDGSGRLAVVTTSPSGVAAFLRRQSVPSGGWDDWQPLLGWSATAPAVVPGGDGRLEAFATSPGGARLSHRWQTVAGGAWDAVEDFGEQGVAVAAPSAAADAAGRLHVFAVTADGRIRTRVQEGPGGRWRPWRAFDERPVALPPPSAPCY